MRSDGAHEDKVGSMAVAIREAGNKLGTIAGLDADARIETTGNWVLIPVLGPASALCGTESSEGEI